MSPTDLIEVVGDKGIFRRVRRGKGRVRRGQGRVGRGGRKEARYKADTHNDRDNYQNQNPPNYKESNVTCFSAFPLGIRLAGTIRSWSGES